MSDGTKPSDRPSVDIFGLLMETAGKEEKKRRAELLAPLGLTEFFVEGSIAINKRTCKGPTSKLLFSGIVIIKKEN
jgi:hypothetical protein